LSWSRSRGCGSESSPVKIAYAFICCQDGYCVVSPFVVVGISELRNVTRLGFVEGRFGGSHREVVDMVLSFGAIYAAVVTVMRFRVLDALFGDRDRDREIFR
jgi:hypothetical protein